MSLEFALESYPVTRKLSDGRDVVVRPLEEKDLPLIETFYPAVPEHERLFIKHPVTDKSLLEHWCRHIDVESNLSFLVLLGDRLIGEGTLHFRNGGWKKHIGLISELTHPDYHGLGVSEIVVQELVGLARHGSLSKLEIELNGERDVAIKAMAKLGFRELLRLPDYLQDIKTNTHEYVLMGMDLITPEEFASAG